MFSIEKLIVFLKISLRTIVQFCGLETPGKIKFNEDRDFPGGPVAETPHSQCTGPPGWIPGQGTRSHMLQLRVCMP